jgi:hypothetical protein
MNPIEAGDCAIEVSAAYSRARKPNTIRGLVIMTMLAEHPHPSSATMRYHIDVICELHKEDPEGNELFRLRQNIVNKF